MKKGTFICEVPYGVVLFGLPFPVDLEMLFTYEKDEDKPFRLEVKSLTGTNGGKLVDYSYLVDDNNRESQFIIECVVANQGTWEKVA